MVNGIYGGFLKWGYPKFQMDGLMEHPIKLDDLRVPLFQETAIYPIS